MKKKIETILFMVGKSTHFHFISWYTPSTNQLSMNLTSQIVHLQDVFFYFPQLLVWIIDLLHPEIINL